MKQSSAIMILLLVGAGMIGLISFTDVTENVEALGSPTNTGYDWNGTDVYELSTGTPWTVTTEETFQDCIIDTNLTDITVMDGNLILKNVTIWWNCSADETNYMRVISGDVSCFNCSMWSIARDIDTFTEYQWTLWVQEGSGKASFNATNTTIISKLSDTFNEPTVPQDNNLYNLAGDLNFYNCNLTLPQQYYISGSGVMWVNFVNTGLVGNKTFGDVNTELNFTYAHFINFHGNDTRNLSISIRDADGDIVAPVNNSLPTGMNLNSSMMFAPNRSCYWFGLLNMTQKTLGISNSTVRYPLNVSIEKPSGWNVTRRYTGKNYSSNEVFTHRWLEDPNQVNTTSEINDTDEDGFTTVTLQTGNLSVNSSRVNFTLQSPSYLIFPLAGWDDWTARLHDPDSRGGYTLDYVDLVADTGRTTFTVELGEVVHLSSGSTSIESTIEDWSWKVRDTNSALIQTLSGENVFLTVADSLYDVGTYTINLTVTDDEEAQNSHLATMIVTDPQEAVPGNAKPPGSSGSPSSSTTPSSSFPITIPPSSSGTSTSAAASKDSAEWYQVWDGDWWEEPENVIVASSAVAVSGTMWLWFFFKPF